MNSHVRLTRCGMLLPPYERGNELATVPGRSAKGVCKIDTDSRPRLGNGSSLKCGVISFTSLMDTMALRYTSLNPILGMTTKRVLHEGSKAPTHEPQQFMPTPHLSPPIGAQEKMIVWIHARTWC